MFSIFAKKPASSTTLAKAISTSPSTKLDTKSNVKLRAPSQMLLDWVKSNNHREPAEKTVLTSPEDTRLVRIKCEVSEENIPKSSVREKEEEEDAMPVITFQPMVSPRDCAETTSNENIAKNGQHRMMSAKQAMHLQRLRQTNLLSAQRKKQEKLNKMEESSVKIKLEPNHKRNRSELEDSPKQSREEIRDKLFAARRSQRLSVYIEPDERAVEPTTPPTPPTEKSLVEVVKIKRERSKTIELPNDNPSVDEASVQFETAERSKPAKFNCSASEKKAKRQKLDTSVAEEADGVVEEVIEEIWHVSLKLVNKEPVPMFLVKWEGYPPESNTFEPYEHLRHTDCVKDFVKRKYELHEDKFEDAVKELLSDCTEHHENYRKKPKSFILRKLSKFDPMLFKCNIFAYIYTYKKVPNVHSFIRNLRYHCILYKCYLKIEEEKAINQSLIDEIVEKENNSLQVVAENFVDFDPIPKFEYLRKVSGCIKSEVNSGCECKDGCFRSSQCCPQNMRLESVYDEDGRICALSHQMIVECNDFCQCSMDCPNRPKQLNISLRVFKTADRGWALKTMQNIPAGTFVIEYTGELIDEAEAKKRTQVYDKTGLTYLFDLDYNDDNEASYSIDATYKGNLSRFINHSCQANLQTWPATTCNENSRMHRLYYISLHAIRAGEELTVDYCGGVHPNFLPSRRANSISCKCGSAMCKGYIF